MFSGKSGVRVIAGILSFGLLALCLYGVLRTVGGVDAARPSPRVGERLSVFVAAYGQPAKLGTDRGLKVNHVTVDGVRFYTDKARTIIVNAQPTQGVVRNLVVTGPASWNSRQSFAYCKGLLPSGAVSYRTVGQYTYFHTSAGDVVLNNAGHGTCQVASVTKSPAP
jgi:hypothetical protein